MRAEHHCLVNDVCIKKITIFTERQSTWVQVLELREDTLGKSGWLPVHLQEYKQYADAKAAYLGFVVQAAYEHGNNTQETYRENLFIRGSLPSAFARSKGVN